MIAKAFFVALIRNDPAGTNGERMRVRFEKEHGIVLDFTVQYETPRDDAPGQHDAVVRYDTAHDRPHRDLLDDRGRTIDEGKQWLDMTYNEALTYAIKDIATNWRSYRDESYGRKK